MVIFEMEHEIGRDTQTMAWPEHYFPAFKHIWFGLVLICCVNYRRQKWHSEAHSLWSRQVSKQLSLNRHKVNRVVLGVFYFFCERESSDFSWPNWIGKWNISEVANLVLDFKGGWMVSTNNQIVSLIPIRWHNLSLFIDHLGGDSDS